MRFRVPDEGAIEFDDVIIRGHVRFENENVEDPVIWLERHPHVLIANAVDDVGLDITHVIRGEDLLSSTPKVIHLRVRSTTELPSAHLPPAGERAAPEALEAP